MVILASDFCFNHDVTQIMSNESRKAKRFRSTAIIRGKRGKEESRLHRRHT